MTRKPTTSGDYAAGWPSTDEQLLDYRKNIERGEAISLYEAISLCAAEGIAMPRWLVSHILGVIADYHLGKKPSWKGSGMKPLIVIRRRIEKQIKIRAFNAVRSWQKNVNHYNEMPTKCIEAWFKQEEKRSTCKTRDDAFRLVEKGLKGVSIRDDGLMLKCSPRTLRRLVSTKAQRMPPPISAEVAAVFGFKDPNSLFGTDLPLPPDID